MTTKDVYEEVKNYFSKDADVEVASGKGAQGIKYKKKMFVMFYKGNLLIKLDPERIAELIATGKGQAFDPGTGKPMVDRVLIPVVNKENWIDLCVESKDFVMKK